MEKTSDPKRNTKVIVTKEALDNAIADLEDRVLDYGSVHEKVAWKVLLGVRDGVDIEIVNAPPSDLH